MLGSLSLKLCDTVWVFRDLGGCLWVRISQEVPCSWRQDDGQMRISQQSNLRSIGINRARIQSAYLECGRAGPFHPVSEMEEEEIKMALKNRSFNVPELIR